MGLTNGYNGMEKGVRSASFDALQQLQQPQAASRLQQLQQLQQQQLQSINNNGIANNSSIESSGMSVSQQQQGAGNNNPGDDMEATVAEAVRVYQHLHFHALKMFRLLVGKFSDYRNVLRLLTTHSLEGSTAVHVLL